ncbi:MAG: hypothetical protein ABI411_01715 [Tahibacter sp.]
MKHRFQLGVHRPPARLSRRHERLVIFICTLVWSSGALWLFFHHFLRQAGEFGDTAHPLESWWLKLHGLAAFAFLWLAGLLWGLHVTRAWPQRQRRWSGGGIFVSGAVLIASGYLLYYSGDELLRGWASVLHWVLGLVSPLLLIVHVLWHGAVHERRKNRAARHQ